LVGALLAVFIVALPASAMATNVPVLAGDTNIEFNSDGGVGQSEAFGYTAQQTGNAWGISVYLTSTDGAAVALYTNDTQLCGEVTCPPKPKYLLDSGSVSSNAKGWVTIPLTNGNVTLYQGTTYWLAIAPYTSSGTVNYRITANGTNMDFENLNSTFGDPFAVGTQYNTAPASIYVDGYNSPGQTPANTGLPVVSGTTTQGSVLTTTNGTWSGDKPLAFRYQWERCVQFPEGPVCSNISGATQRTYTLQSADVGDSIQVYVTATNDAGGASAISTAVGPVS
jgi:hypothetical protein